MKYRGWFEGNDEIMRKIIIKLHSLSPEQRMLDEYERCYSCHLFDGRAYDWSQDFSDYTGEYIKQDKRKPHFEDPIGKEIIDTISAFVFGSDKFPSIAFKAMQDIYPKEDLFERAIDDGTLKEEKLKELNDREKKKLKVDLCNDELHKLSSGILTPRLLNLPMLEATRQALIFGHSIVVIKLVDGVFYLEVINFKNVCNLEFHEFIPEKIMKFSEIYLYEDVDKENPTRMANYWFRRDFTEKEEIYYQPIKENSQKGLPSTFRWERNGKKTVKHDLGFCPAILFKAPNGRSLFYGQLENIKNYIYYTNNIYSGTRKNMDPQYAVLFGEEAMIDDSNRSPKRKGGIWAFTGAKSIEAISPGSGGYDTAREFRKDLKKDIMKACRVDDVPANNQQSGAALTIRLAPTIDAIGEYRICFGEKGLLEVCEMILKIAILQQEKGKEILIRNNAIIPKSDKFICSLGWGEKMPVTEDSIMKAITNSLTAYKGGLIDLEHAVKKIAPFFNVIDIEDMLHKLREKMEDIIGGEDAAQMYGRLVQETEKSNEKKLKNAPKEDEEQGESND